MEFNSRVIHSNYKITAREDIESIINYVYLNVGTRRFNSTVLNKSIVDIRVNGNVKIITIKKKGYKKVYKDYKGITHYKEHPLESITIATRNDKVDIVYRKEEAIHYLHGSLDKLKELLGLDKYNYITDKLINRQTA